MVGMVIAVKRLRRREDSRLEAEAVHRIDAIGRQLADLPQGSTRVPLESQRATVVADFDTDTALSVQRLRRVAATEGLLWRADDRIWNMEMPVIAKLVGLEVHRHNDVVVRVSPCEWETLFGVSDACGSNTLYNARQEALSLAERLLALLRLEAEYREAESLGSLVLTPPECQPGIAVMSTYVLDAPLELPSARAYAALVREENERRRLFDAFVDSMRRAMARAIRHCFMSCLSDASDEEITGDDRVDLHMPDRLYGARRRVAVDIVHGFLNIAHVYGGLHVLSELDVAEGTPILVYNRATRQLLMPLPEEVIEHHWEASQHMLELAVIAEPWIRDHRRRPAAALATTRSRRCVTLPMDESPHVHTMRETAVLEDLSRARDDLRVRYWPSWPPREHALTTPERFQTAMLWGRNAACVALADVKRSERVHVQHEPYHGVSAVMHGGGAHVCLYRAHRETMRVREDEVDEQDLFGDLSEPRQLIQ